MHECIVAEIYAILPALENMLPCFGIPMACFFNSIRTLTYKQINMSNWLRTLLAGYGAYKWGGGCLGTIVVFVLLYWLLGVVGC